MGKKFLRESLGMEKKKRNIVYDNLDHLAGIFMSFYILQ